MKVFKTRSLIYSLCALGLLGMSAAASASAFQLWEQDGASIGNYHAGYAASAEDASVAFYNPAGIVLFDNQQAVFSGAGIMPSFRYKGNVAVNTVNGGKPMPVTAQGGVFSFVPGLSYVAPISDTVGFGFTINKPFEFKTNYGNSTNLRYVATESALNVIDYSPSLGVKINDKASVGVGFDIQQMHGIFNQVGNIGGTSLNNNGLNNADGTGYGYHAGVLYQFTPDTRVGLSYHSQVVHHLSGSSSFTGPLATGFGVSSSNRSNMDMTLPPYTALSLFHHLNPKWAVMASAIYTQWKTIRFISIQNAAGIMNALPSTNVNVNIPQYYRNSWNLSVGSNYYATDKVILRTGLGLDQTPVRNAYRNVQLPDNNRFVIALGGHYQATKTVGMDVSWNHMFMHQAHVIPPAQVEGGQTTMTNGSVTGGADVLGAQVTWDII